MRNLNLNNMNNKYDFKIIEKNRYADWLKYKELQKKSNFSNLPNFTIVIPPPNITGKLHLGHAWNNILQDNLIRRKMLTGYNVLFVPGMDHAGIATQIKIKQELQQKGFCIHKLTKNIFLEFANQWQQKYIKDIRKQWQDLGLLLDYDYEQFTLNPSISSTVEKVFVSLYKEGLIYRDYKIINWDSSAQTTLSDTEINERNVLGKLFYLKYFLIEDKVLSDDFVIVATTRPETIFGDQAVMFHPNDKRYQHLIGKQVVVPGTSLKIPIITDEYVDMSFGSGLLKVTPAHDFNDFQLGQKHNLKSVLCINSDGSMNELAEQYKGLDRFVCRERLISDLDKKNLLFKIEDYNHSLRFANISGIVIEPRLSLQWFLKTKELAKLILKKHKINFFPKRFLTLFNQWLTKIEDWCISRQLWWGHPIPAWYNSKNEVKVQIEDPGSGFTRDSDVLDTWFSSSLWPLCALGWPNNQKLFRKHFPVDVLVTGYDILTFWVVKMVLQSMFFLKKMPFKDVLLHGLIRDDKGQKMSKSKGNGLDPKEIIDQYGIDSLRWFLTTNSSPGLDFYFDRNKIISSWKFANKLWNIGFFIKNNLSTLSTDFDQSKLFLPEKFLLTKLSTLLKKIDVLYDKYEFSVIGKLVYNFVWEEFANWGLEFYKICWQDIEKDPELISNSRKVILYIWKTILLVLHPFMPFITDAIYEELDLGISIISEKIPILKFNDSISLSVFESLKKLVTKMRQFRQINSLNKIFLLDLYLEVPLNCLNEFQLILFELKKIFQASEIKLGSTSPCNNNYELLFADKNIFIFIKRALLLKINQEQNTKNLNSQLNQILIELKRSENLLKNKSFLDKADKSKVQEEKEKYNKYLLQYKKIIKKK
ncbi:MULTISPECIES: valine--tRNA ligase [Candidatus Phytoplasma]|uniref:Valine--tRNA ligase n=2 Tax=Candidatus Phytoplasma TaxID=33926 RepID=A0ABN0J7K3_PEWBP|nr:MULTISPECIES: valine--tRNA ligase [Phytoplasma]QLL37040.1 valyl-tRNA synthetase ['Echinacea purpurea' witches'-broom phytoplasma]WEX20583.1 MAG: valyl-tRNA synthetase [Candidatus Phytoplasma aurantifolia]WKV64292.1 MAG: valyl-tRNA synthetase [Candidatus Phytoplasma australasiaticum]EMR14435.1 valyl-tRNA synthetase [Peanut witches'-broom phytoplasma NTU2011]WMW50343.1 MAG: valyl-tRNA synthetase [Candidatus Phytoplasma australasiaticum]